MGLFDRFRKRVTEVASEVNTDELSAEAESQEAQEALNAAAEIPQIHRTESGPIEQEPAEFEADIESESSGEEWEDLEALDALEDDGESQDEWDDFDDEEDIALPIELSRKERKRVEKARRTNEKRLLKKQKEMKKRGAVDVARPKGSNVDLSMMRTTTGRQLVRVQSAPKGSVKQAEIETEAGTKVAVDLGGGVVSEGGRVIKAGTVLDNLLEELEWVLLESDISSDAVTAVIDALRANLVGARLR